MEISKNQFQLIGLKLPQKTSNLNNQSSRDCGELWQKFEQDKIFDRIPKKLSNEVYAVYYDYETDDSSPFSYFIGCLVEENSPLPDGLEILIIPAQKYKKWVAKGKMTACITNTWKEIWSSNLKRSYTYDFEVYDERSQNWEDAEVDIYVAMKV